MEKSNHCFSIILSLLQHGIKSLIFLGVFFFFPSSQWLPVHPSLPPTILSPSKTPKILNIPSLQSISLQYHQIVIHQLSHIEPSNPISS